MSLPTIEIVVAPSSEAYRNDPNVLINGFGSLAKVDGLESIYFGLQLEDPKTAYVFNVWTTRAHHQRLIDSPSYLKVLEPMSLALERPATITHVQFASDVTVAFKQPVTEVLIHTANNPKDRQKVLELFAEFAKSRNGLATYGALEEKDNVTVFIGGWQSVQDQLETIKAPHLDSIISHLIVLGTADIKHVNLTNHSL